ncbi:hypothetical protein BKA82DRAFT_4461602 [Pisolithus tinctorius]|nr:hypothetical protein BKA82DRAFT_4461602 [Pisolithus tinctorius]
MDNAGWHAQRRAERDSYRYFSRRHRGSDGQYVPEVVVGPLPSGQYTTQSPPELAPRPSNVSDSAMHRVGLAQLPPAERARAQRIPQMDPVLQFMVGPLLRYDTVDMNGVWHGAALIVTADAGSFYDPVPVLTYQWDPEEPARTPNGSTLSTFSKYDLSPHPADPHATALLTWEESKTKATSIDQTQRVVGQEIYVYSGRGGTFTFWRFPIRIQLGYNELCIKYSINGGMQLSFHVPTIQQNMRWATYSCNGFSAGVNPDDFRGPGFRSGYDPMWVDLLQQHSQKTFPRPGWRWRPALLRLVSLIKLRTSTLKTHSLTSLTREPEMQDWVHSQNITAKLSCPLTPEITECIDRFLFNHYCASFRHGAFARANSSIPMLNMCDPDDLQSCPIFQAIGSRGYFFFLLFQCFINPYYDGLSDRHGEHPFKSLVLGFQGPFVGLPSHSFLAPLGPNVQILMLDCRAERKKDTVCSQAQYKKIYDYITQLPSGVEHLIVQLGIPIAYPRLVFLETALESKLNPLIALGRTRSFGLGGLVNKFNSDAELLDDLNDHWTATAHKKERNTFIQELQGIAKMKRLRITFLSGDVHCAAVGVLKTLAGGKNTPEVPPSVDFRYMINVVTSAIVNTPPPVGVITMVSSLATKMHKTLHYAQTDETMMAQCALKTSISWVGGTGVLWRWDNRTGEMIFDLRVEKEKGVGTSVGYEVKVPPPQWAPGR